MSQRTFKYFSIAAGGTPQPLVGTTLSAAVTSNTPPANKFFDDKVVTLPVVDSSMFLEGDWVMLDSTGAPVEERVLVLQVPNGTSIVVRGMANAHASGAYVRLAVLMNSIYIQTLDGNTGAIYIGTSSAMVKATGAFVISKLQPVTAGVQPIELYSTRSGLANADNLGQLWVDGTTGDKYLPSIGQM